VKKDCDPRTGEGCEKKDCDPNTGEGCEIVKKDCDPRTGEGCEKKDCDPNTGEGCEIVKKDCDPNTDPNCGTPITTSDCDPSTDPLCGKQTTVILLRDCSKDPKGCADRFRTFKEDQGPNGRETDRAAEKIMMCNSVSLYGQNEECNPVDEAQLRFEVDPLIFSIEVAPPPPGLLRM
jgi:hypothetical protein